MRLKNVLITVTDMDRAIQFYRDLFGLQVILQNDGNVVMTEGLVLQETSIWQKCLGKEVITKNHGTELYFVENNLEEFIRKLDESYFEIEYVTSLTINAWGNQVVRFYDPDGNLIEVSTYR